MRDALHLPEVGRHRKIAAESDPNSVSDSDDEFDYLLDEDMPR